MYRSLLALLFAAVLLLSGCAAGRQTVPKEKSGQEANMDDNHFICSISFTVDRTNEITGRKIWDF